MGKNKIANEAKKEHYAKRVPKNSCVSWASLTNGEGEEFQRCM